MATWAGIVLIGLMGVSLGLLGGGGSILAVPILVYFFHLEAHAAIAMSLVLVGGTALVAALLQHRNGYVDWRGGLLFAALGAPFTALGTVVSQRFSGALLLLLFGVLMLAAGAAMLLPRGEAPETAAGTDWGRLALSGTGVGFLTGFLGVGGGFLIVPSLVLLSRMPMKQAIGTSLLVIAANCAVALVGRWHFLEMSWAALAAMSVAALSGTGAGVLLSRRLEAAHLRRAFGVLVILVGGVMVWRHGAELLR